MNKNRIISLFILLIMLFEMLMPSLCECYYYENEEIIEEDGEISEKIKEIEKSEEIIDELESNEEQEEVNIENTEEKIEEIKDTDKKNGSEVEVETKSEKEINYEKEINLVNNIDEEINDEFEVTMDENIGISVASASGWGTGAGNEDEFRNAFYNGGVSELTISTSIRLNSIYTVNHNLRIDSSSQTGSNALQLSSGCSIVVPSGCVLTLDEVVLDGRSFGNNDGKSCITVQNGGVLMLTGHSIIDGGTRNWGINVESGGQLLVESCQISYCDRGVVLQGNSYCDFASSTTVSWWGNTGKSVDISYNSIGIYCGGAYRGNLIVNHISGSSEKINFDSNTWAIFSEAHSGNINIVTARMVFNGWAIYTFGNMNVAGINGAYNARGIVNDRRNG